MNESYRSTKDFYGISCDELDNLINICLKNGALGSKITGAGWGGCCISLVKNSDVDNFITKVKQDYYIGDKGVINDCTIFSSIASAGATIFEIKSNEEFFQEK